MKTSEASFQNHPAITAALLFCLAALAQATVNPRLLRPTSQYLSWPGHSRGLETFKIPFRNIRIKLETSLIPNQTTNTFTFVADSVIQRTLNYVERLLRVSGPTAIPHFSDSECFDPALIPQSYKTSKTDTDFVIFLKFDELQPAAIANSRICMISTFDCRPLVGMLSVNPFKIKIGYENLIEYQRAFLKELLHMLAFDKYLLDKYPTFFLGKLNYEYMELNSQSEERFLVVKSEKILKAGQEHFGCKEFVGLVMENRNDRYDKQVISSRYFGNELMSSTNRASGPLSIFTLTFLIETGWYEVDMSLEEPLAFGKNAGCEFFKICDRAMSEFCMFNGAMECSKDRLQKTVCQNSSRIDKCSVDINLDGTYCNSNREYKKTYELEATGKNSRCLDVVENGSIGSGCFTTTCVNNQIVIQVNGKSLTCKSKGERIIEKNVMFMCPDVNEICPAMAKCPGECGNNGRCLANGACICDPFYSGANCENKLRCFEKEKSICNMISPFDQSKLDPAPAAKPAASLTPQTTAPAPAATSAPQPATKPAPAPTQAPITASTGMDSNSRASNSGLNPIELSFRYEPGNEINTLPLDQQKPTDQISQRSSAKIILVFGYLLAAVLC
jgi:hypothetical protein